MFNYQCLTEEEQVVVQGCQKLVLILLQARRTKANNTSAMGGVHLIITPPLNGLFMYVQ